MTPEQCSVETLVLARGRITWLGYEPINATSAGATIVPAMTASPSASTLSLTRVS